MKRRNLIVAIAVVSALTACTSKNESKNNGKMRINSTAITENASLTPAEKAEQLALAAEQLVSGTSFMYADAVAETALSIDATNKRAQLVRALVGPAMATKGALERAKPIAYRNAKSKADYDKFLADFDKAPNHALKKFLFSGQTDIKNEKDVQNFIGGIVSAVDRLRVFFKSNKNMTITLNVPGEKLQGDILDKKQEECYWQQEAEGVYENTCDLKDVLQIKVERADIEGMQQIVAGYQVYFTLINAYSLAGAIGVSDKYKDAEVSGNVIREELLKVPEFATLRDAKGLSAIVTMGIDAIAGVRWAKNLQQQLCAAGQSDESNRPGYVLSSGICIQDRQDSETSLEEMLKNVELALSGGLVDATFKGQHGEYTTKIKPVSVLKGSVQDVRDLDLIFDNCGRVVSAGDSTLGGVFAKKDAGAVLSLNRQECFE